MLTTKDQPVSRERKAFNDIYKSASYKGSETFYHDYESNKKAESAKKR